MEPEKMNHARQVPAGVKVIAVFYYIVAAFHILRGITVVIASFYFGLSGGLIAILPAIALGIGIDAGVLYVFIGRGLWKGRPWARIAAIAVAAIVIFVNLISLFLLDFSALIFIAINGAVLLYLLLSKSVNRAFA